MASLPGIVMHRFDALMISNQILAGLIVLLAHHPAFGDSLDATSNLSLPFDFQKPASDIRAVPAQIVSHPRPSLMFASMVPWGMV